jgi:hypothetical protein
MRKRQWLFLVLVFVLSAGGCSTTGKSPEARAPEAVVYGASIKECSDAVEETLRELGDSFTKKENSFLTEAREYGEFGEMELRLATYRTFVRKSIRLLPAEGGGTEVRVEVTVYKRDYLNDVETQEDDPALESEVRGEFFEVLGKRLSPAGKPRRMRPEDSLRI